MLITSSARLPDLPELNAKMAGFMTDAVIFADSGAQVGLGHLRRCLVLAKALDKRGVAVTVLTPDAAGRDIAAQAGFATAECPVDLSTLPKADILVADSYRIDAALCRSWADRFMLRVMIDDMADRPLDADLILNPDIDGPTLDYSKVCDCPVRAGLEYSLVDPAFAAFRDQRRSAPPRVLVAFGGTDDGRLGAALAQAILKKAGTPIDLVVSPLHQPAKAATDLAQKELELVTLHHGPAMIDLMSRASIYAGACGTTIWEASAAGLGVVAAAIAENQTHGIEVLTEHGIEVFDHVANERMADAVASWLTKPRANPLMELIDGGGAERAVDAILDSLTGSSFDLEKKRAGR